MSGFFWNVRGFNKTNKQLVVKEWVSQNSFLFGGLLETRVSEARASRISGSVFQDWSMEANYDFNRLGRI